MIKKIIIALTFSVFLNASSVLAMEKQINPNTVSDIALIIKDLGLQGNNEETRDILLDALQGLKVTNQEINEAFKKISAEEQKSTIHIDPTFAKSGAASCPQVMSISALKEIIKEKINSKVKWADTEWTLVLNPFASGELPHNATTTQLWHARNNNGTLECYYELAGTGYGMVELTTVYEGP